MLAGATLAMAQKPVPDHPLISRFVGSTVAESSVSEFDEFPLILGQFKDGKFKKIERLEGKISHFRYMAPPNHSTRKSRGPDRPWEHAARVGTRDVDRTCG